MWKKRAVLSRHLVNSNSNKTPMITKKTKNKMKRRKKDRGMSTVMSARMGEMSCAAMAATKSLTISALASSLNLRVTGSARIAQPRSPMLLRKSKPSSAWVVWATSV